MRTVAGVRWSKTLRGWTIPDAKENRQKCSLSLQPASAPVYSNTVVQQQQPPQQHLSSNNAAQLQLFIQQLTLKAYSSSTIRTYRNEFIPLLQLLSTVPVQNLLPQHLQRYILYCKKHKAILFTAYSAGLRVSDVVHLKITDIDSQRMQIFIQRAKGKKDRYVNLSPMLLDILRSYVQNYTPKPSLYLFESEQSGTAYPCRTVQQIFTNAKEKAGSKKEAGIHSLRHSFATHLLEKGVDIQYIKELLGHFNIKTTERYLHVSKRKLVNIISPLDDLLNNHAIKW